MFYLFIIFSVIIDQTSKFFVKSGFLASSRINILSDFLYFQPSKNTGIAFSFPIEGILLKIITILLIGGIFYFYFYTEKNKKTPLVQMGYGLILGGAISNALERVFVGYVIDFIGIKYFAIFNFADIFITVGAILLLLIYTGLWNKPKI